MTGPRPEPTGRERTFGHDEIIVTKTDGRGRITYANDVFLRVSAYAEDEVIGRPHNIVRHPDMPRAVFKLMWDTIEAGREIFAYALNLAGDGSHYWVFAHVTPTFDAQGRVVGHHSSRRSPSRAAIERIRPVYRQLLDEEARHRRHSAAVEASLARLDTILQGLDLTYDEFVWSITDTLAGAR